MQRNEVYIILIIWFKQFKQIKLFKPFNQAILQTEHVLDRAQLTACLSSENICNQISAGIFFIFKVNNLLHGHLEETLANSVFRRRTSWKRYTRDFENYSHRI